MESSAAKLAAVVAGSTSYWTYFFHNEHHDYGTTYIKVFIALVAGSSIAATNYASVSFGTALVNSLRLAGIFLGGVYLNCIIYRLFLNPLNRFPGPYFARLTKLDHCFRNGKLMGHFVLLDLHKKYGKFVRIGPNDLSCVDPAGTQILLGVGSKCAKGPWYDGDKPLLSMHTTRDKTLHDRRRRVWAPAFSDKALRGYESRIQVYNDQLIAKLKETQGKPVNATNLINLYAFDVMGDLGFGKSFGALPKGEPHFAIKLLNEGMDPLGLSLPTWLFRVIVAIPGLAHGFWKFINYCTKALEDRIAIHDEMVKKDPEGEKRDVVHILIDQYHQSDNKKDLFPMLSGDARLIIVAGSDTTSATLSYLFYHIADKPEWQRKLRDEIEGLRKNAKNGELRDVQLKDAPVLNGMINETLRLNPPVPSGVFRMAPPEGIEINGTYVPGRANIQMPMYVMSRSEDNYVKPLEFLPMRWSSDPQLVKQPDAFVPFSTGPYGCIGKNLAYMEVRTVVSQIIQQFDVKFGPGEDGHRLLMQTTDHFTLGLQPLDLTFTRRD